MTKRTIDTPEIARAHPATENEIKAFEGRVQHQGPIYDSKWNGRSTFSVEEAADVLGLSRATAYAAANAGDLPVVRIGRRMLVPRLALEKLLLSAGV